MPDDQDRCPFCGEYDFNGKHICGGVSQPIPMTDAVSSVEAVAQKTRDGLAACGASDD